MKKIYMALSVVTIFTFSGCAINGTNVSQNGTVTIELQDSELLHILWADAYVIGDNLEIRGVIEQHHHSVDYLRGQVFATIMDADGKELQQASSSVVNVPKDRVGKGTSWARFTITIPITVSKGMIIKLRSKEVFN